MPFTVSHAAAVLPLHRLSRGRLPLAAMMIGSMSPDFAYFLPMGLGRGSTHDLEGLFLFCWPVGLGVWLLYVRLLERATIELLPLAWRERVSRSDSELSFRSLALVSLGVILGAITHIAWDSFTHANTIMTDTFPALSAELFTFRGRSIRVFLVLQYLSSVVGLVALAIWAFDLRHASAVAAPVRTATSSLPDRLRVGAVLMMVAASGAAALLGYAGSAGPFEARVFHMLIGGMTGWFVAWCAVAVLISRLRFAR